MLYVKMRPHKPGGHKRKRYSCEGVILELGMPWRRVSMQFGDMLKGVKDRNGNKVFFVKTYEEAQEMDVKEEAVEVRQAQVSTPVVLARSDAPPASELPVPGYTSLSARKVIAGIKGGKFEEAELGAMLAYETTHSKRVTVLRAIRHMMEELEADKAADAEAELLTG